MHRWALVTAAGLFTLAVAYADYITGLEVRIYPLYFVPVGVVSWGIGRTAGVISSAASISAWEVANRLCGLRCSSVGIDVWNVFVQLAALIAFAVLLSRLRASSDRERRAAREDRLTGLSNSRAFFERAAYELERARRLTRPLSVAYLDLDGFKQINDRHGHDKGDEVLRMVGRTLTKICRRTDIAARLGGDEFVILFPESDAVATQSLLERLRTGLSKALTASGHAVTASIGVACFESPPDSVEELLTPADELMYRVKRSGKNAVLIEESVNSSRR
jgi:diguanylate cyclase (GGDEF)-like protein